MQYPAAYCISTIFCIFFFIRLKQMDENIIMYAVPTQQKKTHVYMAEGGEDLSM